MKKAILILLVWASFSYTISAQTNDLYFASYPSLSPDAKTAVFCYEGDIWKADLPSKIATRLTAMVGNETRPRISPDGKWVAFSGGQYGNADVYVMPLEGGTIRQLTFHDAADLVESWTWDSQSIYLTSSAYNGGTTYKISLNGGTPVRIFKHFFNRTHNVIEHPSSGELFFNDTWESDNQAYRKGYKGEFNPDIQSYNLKTKAYKRYTEYNGKDFWTTIDRSGKIYFVSDEGNSEYNLYTFEGSKKTALTNFKDAIKRPQVSANGEKVIFEKDYQLFLYDVSSKKTQPLQLTLNRNLTLPKAQDFNVKGNVTDFDVAPDGKKMAFSSRGQLFVSDLEGKFVRQLNTKVDGRVLEVKWLSDSKTLIFNQTVNGYQNWFSIAADGKGIEKQLTNDLRNNRDLTLNKDRTLGVFLSGRDEIKTIDLKAFTIKTIAKEEIWGFQNSKPYISPNDEYVVFMAKKNFEGELFLHNLIKNQTINLTNTGITEENPYWSPDGKYLYFASNRTKASYPFGLDKERIYRLPLSKIEAPFKSDKFNDLFKTAEKKTDDKAKTDTTKTKKIEPMVIDFEGLMERMEAISPSNGSADSPIVIQKDTKTFVIYPSDHVDGKNNLYKTTIEPFTPNKTEKIDGADASSTNIVQADGKYYALINGTICKLNLDGNKADKIDISFTFRKDFNAEFKQMFYETWANVGENFYNEALNNLNWEGIKKKYEAFLPYINTRADFRTMLNDMLGELNASHTGFSSFGSEENTFFKTTTLATGIMFEEENPYKVKYIVKKSAADKAGKGVAAGDVLTKVNGESIDTKQNRDFYFQKPSMDDEIELTFARKDSSFSVKIHPQSSGSLASNLYDEWIQWNQNYVDAKSKKRIAYAHMRNMGNEELEKFLIDMTSEGYNREGLIFDLRYNTGGNVHDLVLNFLAQKPYLKWKYREGKFTIQPNFAPAAKPLVLLINEQSLSDAEMTAQGFKQLQLGKIIGTETYRWIIFTSGKSLVDGSFYRLPAWGCYTLDGKNIETEGVKPDIYIKQTFKDRLEDKDPQLDKAIEEILKGL
ncbi:peptidase S41 [Emticicia oligotrophica DSM 17448]|uniref:Tricorn protease homolog n=1 Tax=Emticicia oligotrophica (strain DSM 17448 / CIP 109782 / MTCC 6937 / GPTSA100-15) TaxID=929562 RepID=A0ABN4AJU2_EMTOG|nr:S41 family peptidase [Emticicia oligotrophica]AFK02437.1 peptidase S41 [Emticicia oligotrophica DSM 17448]